MDYSALVQRLFGQEVTATHQPGELDENKQPEVLAACDAGRAILDDLHEDVQAVCICEGGVAVIGDTQVIFTGADHIPVLEDLPDDLDEARGAGRGTGGLAQWDGGADKCVCPECGTTTSHERGTPCNESKCPKCGAKMIGESVDEAATMYMGTRSGIAKLDPDAKPPVHVDVQPNPYFNVVFHGDRRALRDLLRNLKKDMFYGKAYRDAEMKGGELRVMWMNGFQSPSALRSEIESKLGVLLGESAGVSFELDEMAFSRQHFQAVADVVKSLPARFSKKEAASKFAESFRLQNPNFKDALFMRASGVSESIEESRVTVTFKGGGDIGKIQAKSRQYDGVKHSGKHTDERVERHYQFPDAKDAKDFASWVEREFADAKNKPTVKLDGVPGESIEESRVSVTFEGDFKRTKDLPHMGRMQAKARQWDGAMHGGDQDNKRITRHFHFFDHDNATEFAKWVEKRYGDFKYKPIVKTFDVPGESREDYYSDNLDEAAFTREHFTLVADVLKASPATMTKTDLANDLADALSEKNERFARGRFLTACGVKTSESVDESRQSLHAQINREARAVGIHPDKVKSALLLASRVVARGEENKATLVKKIQRYNSEIPDDLADSLAVAALHLSGAIETESRLDETSLRQFIRDNKAEIDAAIRRVVPDARIDDDEREMWIMNDEGLYNWARSEGVRLESIEEALSKKDVSIGSVWWDVTVNCANEHLRNYILRRLKNMPGSRAGLRNLAASAYGKLHVEVKTGKMSPAAAQSEIFKWVQDIAAKWPGGMAEAAYPMFAVRVEGVVEAEDSRDAALRKGRALQPKYNPKTDERIVVDTRTAKGLKKAERLQAQGWKMGKQMGLDKWEMFRKRGSEGVRESIDESMDVQLVTRGTGARLSAVSTNPSRNKVVLERAANVLQQAGIKFERKRHGNTESVIGTYLSFDGVQPKKIRAVLKAGNVKVNESIDFDDMTTDQILEYCAGVAACNPDEQWQPLIEQADKEVEAGNTTALKRLAKKFLKHDKKKKQDDEEEDPEVYAEEGYLFVTETAAKTLLPQLEGKVEDVDVTHRSNSNTLRLGPFTEDGLQVVDQIIQTLTGDPLYRKGSFSRMTEGDDLAYAVGLLKRNTFQQSEVDYYRGQTNKQPHGIDNAVWKKAAKVTGFDKDANLLKRGDWVYLKGAVTEGFSSESDDWFDLMAQADPSDPAIQRLSSLAARVPDNGPPTVRVLKALQQAAGKIKDQKLRSELSKFLRSVEAGKYSNEFKNTGGPHSQMSELLSYIKQAVATAKNESVDESMRAKQARKVASEWHGGQRSALYAFSSTGTVQDGLADEIEDNIKDVQAKPGDYDKGALQQLKQLLAFVKLQESVDEAFTPGLKNRLETLPPGVECPACGAILPKYPGRYPATCPSCGERVASMKESIEEAVELDKKTLDLMQKTLRNARIMARGETVTWPDDDSGDAQPDVDYDAEIAVLSPENAVEAIDFLRRRGVEASNSSPRPGSWYTAIDDEMNYDTGGYSRSSYFLKGFPRDVEQLIHNWVGGKDKRRKLTDNMELILDYGTYEESIEEARKEGKHHTRIKTVADLKDSLRAGPYAWPGGYPLFFITADGGALSFKTVEDNLREVMDAIRTNDRRSGWRVEALDVNYENDDLYDDHTGKKIESAYGESVDEGTIAVRFSPAQLAKDFQIDEKDAKKVLQIAKRMNDNNADNLLQQVDKLIGGFGVEIITDRKSEERLPGANWDQPTAAAYVNTGDTYNLTVLYDYYDHKPRITAWGDWVEEYERKVGYRIESVDEGSGSVADKHQKRIAIDTVRNPAKAFLGGPSEKEAVEILKTKFGYTDAQIKKLRESVEDHLEEAKGHDITLSWSGLSGDEKKIGRFLVSGATHDKIEQRFGKSIAIDYHDDASGALQSYQDVMRAIKSTKYGKTAVKESVSEAVEFPLSEVPLFESVAKDAGLDTTKLDVQVNEGTARIDLNEVDAALIANLQKKFSGENVSWRYGSTRKKDEPVGEGVNKYDTPENVARSLGSKVYYVDTDGQVGVPYTGKIAWYTKQSGGAGYSRTGESKSVPKGATKHTV
jgi:rubrerythrin